MIPITNLDQRSPTRVRLWLVAGLLLLAMFTRVVNSGTVVGRSFQRLDLAPAGSQISGGADLGGFLLTFTGPVEAQVVRDPDIPLAYVDILGGKLEVSPVLMPFPNGPARLVRLHQTQAQPPVVRATFFLRQRATPLLVPAAQGLMIGFSSKGSAPSLPSPADRITQTADGRPVPFPPMAPGTRAWRTPAPVAASEETARAPASIHLDVKGADVSTLLQELARQSGMSLHFRDPFTGQIDLKVSGVAPLEAMSQIMTRVGGTLTIEDREIWISRRDNPLLSFADDQFIEKANLQGLAVGDVLRALGQMGDLNIVLDRSVGQIKDQPVDVLFQKQTYRRAFETLLNLYELDIRPVDSRTLLVLTKDAARTLAGRVVRIFPLNLPFTKMKDLIDRSLSEDQKKRVTIQEDLGNLVAVGDHEVMSALETQVKSLEGKMERAGEGVVRVMFHPVNTKPADLVKLVETALGDGNKPQMIVDERTDAIVIVGPKILMERAMSLLRNLDKTATRQAIIQVKLLEISRRDLNKLGVRLGADKIGVADITQWTHTAIPADFIDSRDLTNARTLANPTVRCMDKQEAKIDISEQIPVKNTVTEYLPIASASLAARTSDNWTTTDVGIKLTLKPFIHQNRELSMEVNVDQTEVISFVEGRPWTSKRNIQTQVRMKDRETVVIGGLIKRKRSDNEKPLPIVSRIPFLKRWFKRVEFKDRTHEESEMVVLITPRVIESVGLNQPDEQLTTTPIQVSVPRNSP
ncbi:MAG TPA: hypothetical protein PKO06_05590 [Candidatus Ozemobacteraceae bacterium]|nr:hypothetical protein [Candidatus Ozemobacteraceae bacterium]